MSYAGLTPIKRASKNWTVKMNTTTKINPELSQFPKIRLVFWKKDISQMMGISTRTLDRMISVGDIPQPDLSLRGRRAWKAKTIHGWVEEGCPSKIIS